MQKVVQGMAWAITKVMRVSGAETTSVCASVFIGQTEAPLTVRPYISKMTESELLTMMIGGMAHIAGGVLAVYIGMLGRHRSGAAGSSTPSICWPRRSWPRRRPW